MSRRRIACGTLHWFVPQQPVISVAYMLHGNGVAACGQGILNMCTHASCGSQVMQEIEERRAFLRDMESAGALKREMQQQVRLRPTCAVAFCLHFRAFILQWTRGVCVRVRITIR